MQRYSQDQLRRMIGELLVVGYQGFEPSSEFLDFVKEWGVGGVIVFARNLAAPSDLPAVLKRISEYADKTLFTAIDQEGGLVMRILSEGSLFPGAMALAASGDPNMAYLIAKAEAEEMLALGLNWNLAPVLDINHAQNPGIGARSFGDSPQTVIKYSIPYIKGLMEGGVAACAKHFPGKGHAKVDSHLTLPVIPYDRKRLLSFELAPFKAAIAAGVDAIMTAHVFFPAFESLENLPATLSKSVLTGLLRDELGFKGLVITDDLEMGAITEAFGVAEAAKRAFLAGADLLLICHTLEHQRAAAEAVLQAVLSSEEAMNRLEETLARIAEIRSKLIFKKTPIDLRQIASSHAELVSKAHDLAVLVDATAEGDLPLSPLDKIIVACPHIASLVQVEEEHREAGPAKQFEQAFPNSTCILYEPKGSQDEILQKLKEHVLRNPDARVILLSYNAHIFPGQEAAFKSLASMRHRTILAALRNPYDLAAVPEASTRIAVFGFRSPDIESLIKLLQGKIAIRSECWPVRLRS